LRRKNRREGLDMKESHERDPRTYAIIGAAMAVHRELGCGFLEEVYGEALETEFGERGIPYLREALLPLHYRGQKMSTFYKADFICFDEVVVEIKSLATLTGREEAQLINYLKATGYRAGLLLNFGAESLEFRRYVHTP